MKRPIGVLLAAIVLGLTATVQLLLAAVMVFAGVLVGGHGLGTSANPAALPPPTAHAAAILMYVMAVFLLALAVWGGTTVVGLGRLRNWARYSILVIGGLLAFFGLASVGILALIPAMMAASQPNAALPASVMHGMLLVMGLFYLSLAAVGAWWLVYFNLHSVKAYFRPTYQQHGAPVHQYDPYRQSAASLATPGGLADYPPPPPYLASTPGRLANLPTSIIVIAVLYLLGAVFTLGAAFLPLPGFILGFILTGWATHLLYFSFAV